MRLTLRVGEIKKQLCVILLLHVFFSLPINTVFSSPGEVGASTTRPRTLTDNFNHYYSPHWTVGHGEWEIVDHQLRGQNGLLFTKSLFEGDYLYMEVAMKTENAGINPWEVGRIYVRYVDLDNCICIFLGRDRHLYLTIRKINEDWKEWSEFVGESPDRWHRIGIELNTRTIRVYLNKELVLKVTDEWLDDYSGSSIAFDTFGSCYVLFDDFKCYNQDAMNGDLGNSSEDFTRLLAEWTIESAHEYYNGYYFYHYLSEFSLDEERNDEWYIMWMDDMFYIMTGRYDYDFLAKALDTYALATMKLHFTHTSPRLHVVKMDTQMIDARVYGALYFNIMVYQYVKWTAEVNGSQQALSRAKEWKEAVIKNHNYIKSNFIRDDVFYVSDVKSTLQPDYVRKGGYVADMTIYYLCSLRTLDYVYGIDTKEEFHRVQQALKNKLWDEDLGFFIDWIDPEERKHIHYGTEQLWGVVFDVLPEHQQKRMFESLPKSRERCGRFWHYQRYTDDELADAREDPWWDDWWKISEAMLYIKTLRIFNYNETEIQSLIEPFRTVISEYDHFPDTYTWDDENQKFIKNSSCNLIMNAGPWLAIIKDVDLSFASIADASSDLSAETVQNLRIEIEQTTSEINLLEEKIIGEISKMEANYNYSQSVIEQLERDISSLREEYTQSHEEQIQRLETLERYFYAVIGGFVVFAILVIFLVVRVNG